ncbi:DUF86 domain-containing protein [Pseudotamlana carrageenivorans]|uniref:DUF86 domain-containing protein n=1 Tax=Pseudotamlana carrageenivorans TaxID=2069432 RepID=A0A2I7SDY3_9FLAO|nr:HepT-like ribonuclease domain-containing protein [Tamlana carrageenivorans]AUS04101.1 hypothetical protein C1A40_00765 [Tamlana carrageenivorans]
MTDKSKKYLSDILIAIELIEKFTLDILDFRAYQEDFKKQSAVERQLSIIGEALNQFRKTEPDISIENAAQIIGFRNRLVHAYGSIDDAIVWAIINIHIRKLKTEVENKFGVR